MGYKGKTAIRYSALLLIVVLLCGSAVAYAQTATPEPPTPTPAPPTFTPAPPTPTPGGGTAVPPTPTLLPNTCNGQTATIFETIGSGHDGLVQGTQSADVIKVVIADLNADVTVVGLKGDDLICVSGDSRKVVVNGNNGADSCQYTGTSAQQSHLHCETVLP